ncbi:MAG TPA: SCO6880 family protein [Dermatophilaceae bacterium]|nr:SCO6880 family protein [Dermatophilaceae bacterium]
MAVIYSDYSRARIGWFFGLSGWQLGVVALSTMPMFWSVQSGAWLSAGLFLALWAVVVLVTVTPVRGRSTTGWITASVSFAIGGLAGWTRFRSKASRGQADSLEEADLPGALHGVQIHDGPPHGPSFSRIAIIQNHTSRTWAVTASVVHPGIGLREPEERERQGRGLSELLDIASQTELVDNIMLLVRTVPEDGAERDQWLARHRRPVGAGAWLGGVRQINDELQHSLTKASVRTESFVTVVIPEARLGKQAKESGGGLEGRARVIYGLLGEIDAQLRGGLGMTSVKWLTSPELALAARTGFAPGDRAGIIDALGARQANPDANPPVNADVPWAMAGPSGADPAARHYSHDAWNSISSTVKLPVKGAAMGALLPVLTPTEPGERRSFLVSYPILSQSAAGRQSATSEWAADIGEELRVKAKMKRNAKSRDEADKVRRLDTKLARGNSLTRPYAVCTVTVPKTARVSEFGRRLDASIRRAGFAPLRLDLAQDAAFAASTMPFGVSLTRTAD